MDAAFNVSLAPHQFYGRADVDVFFCVLEKGTGRVLYDENVHSLDQRRTSIEMTVTALSNMPGSNPVSRQMIAESREWTQIVLPSLKSLGITSLRELKGKWVKVQLVPTGRKWVDREGQEREATTFRFLALYNSEDECRTAWLADTGKPDTAEEATSEPAPANNTEKATAYEFLKVLVNTHHNDREKLATTIASIPQISKWFTIDSPETQDLLRTAN
jgi:hypothetical protein